MTKENIEVDKFNREVGTILMSNRLRVGLSENEVALRIVDLNQDEIKEIEMGSRSLPCFVLYKLLTEVYKPTPNEIMFFCSPLSRH